MMRDVLHAVEILGFVEALFFNLPAAVADAEQTQAAGLADGEVGVPVGLDDGAIGLVLAIPQHADGLPLERLPGSEVLLIPNFDQVSLHFEDGVRRLPSEAGLSRRV